MVGGVNCWALLSGVVFIILVSSASAETLGACVTTDPNNPIFDTWGGPDPSEISGSWGAWGAWGGGGIDESWGSVLDAIQCVDDYTESECMALGANFDLEYVWVENTACAELLDSTIPQPTDLGACMIVGGEMYDGFCLDNYTIMECQQLIGIEDGVSTVFFVNQTCSEFAGACRFTELESIPIDETYCTPEALQSPATWLGDECCVEGVYGLAGGLAMTQGLCEGYFNGEFDGIGSTCGGTTTTTTLHDPVSTPEYPAEYVPVLISLLTVSAMFFITKRK